MVSGPGRILLLCLAARAAVLAQSIAGIAIAVPPSAEYFERVDEVAGQPHPDNLDEWMPFGIAVTNHSSQNVVALVVRWSGPGVKMRAAPSMFSDPARQIAPGKSVVVIPGSVLPPKHPLSNFHLGVFQKARPVDVMLDGVVFASGQFCGPNVSKGYEQFVAETTAPARVASTILAMRQSGEATGTVAAWLETNSRTHGTDAASRIAARTAQSLAQSYKLRGEAAIYQLAEILAKGPGIHIYR